MAFVFDETPTPIAPKQVVAEPASIATQFRDVSTALLHSQSAAQAESAVLHFDWMQVHEVLMKSVVATLASESGVQAAASPPSSVAASAAASFPVAPGVLSSELHPIPTAPAPVIETAARATKNREERIT
jgi:hypothetical protein